MQKIYPLRTGGGKGNTGMFIERDIKVCAAGVPSKQATESVAGCLRNYTLQDEVESLIGDSIKPKPKPYKLPPLRKPPQKDLRHAGLSTDVRYIVNPPMISKFETLVEDFKCTIYAPYWKNRVGAGPDQTPNLPQNFDFKNTTLGKKTEDHGRLYDVVMPINPVPDKTPAAKEPAFQTDRNYCKSSYNSDSIFGKKTNPDHHGKWAKLCLTDDRVLLGLRNVALNKQLVDFNNSHQALTGKVLTPNDNIKCVSPGYSFGKLKPPNNLPECLTNCKINPDRDLFRKCLKQLNTLRKCLRTKYDKAFFAKLYLNLKYFDKCKTAWLPKQFVYDFCRRRFIIFNHLLLEPLLATLNAFDGTQINYKFFVDIINYAIPIPDLPKVWDVPDDCIDFRTTYSEMVKPDQKPVIGILAGIPSGRYLDLDYPITPNRCCKADRVYLPEETDARACLNPSTLTVLGVSHRDMYAKRTPGVVRKVFEAIGEKFSDEKFEKVWSTAKKDHSQEWVCFETFRQALEKANN